MGATTSGHRDTFTSGPRRAAWELFGVSLLILFAELACIRWFGAHVLFLTFFTNMVLLACFLGMSVGCLAAERTRSYLSWTPILLVVALGAAHGVTYLRSQSNVSLEVGNQSSPQVVFFGTEYAAQDVARFVVPIEVVGGVFFLLIALAFVGPGQELGRRFNRLPDRLQAYTCNIFGSLVGIALFAACSWAELSPLWWFLPVALGLGYFLARLPADDAPALRWTLYGVTLLLVPLLANLYSGVHAPEEEHSLGHSVTRLFRSEPSTEAKSGQAEFFWSPYYRVEYRHPPSRYIDVNQIGHQQMVPCSAPAAAYALPHLLNRDSGGQPFGDVLIIGAGSGNDVSRALQWGARHVDAVEIDPVIHRLGRQDHPDRPYDDARVTVHLDDGRNFLRRGERQYDLIVYALVDSLVLHSSYSNIRLESYLFTLQAFADVRRRLKPDGVFVMYNFFRQGWLVARLQHSLAETFGSEPLVMSLPSQDTIQPHEELLDKFTLFAAGNTQPWRAAFEKQTDYWLRADRAPGPDSPNGFQNPFGAAEPGLWHGYGLARVVQPTEPVGTASDDWPFLYLRRAMIPDTSLRGMVIMGGLAIVLLWIFRPRTRAGASGGALPLRMFFLGAGFMLVETKAVVQMALLFGSTWVVNSIVFFAVLVMILGANVFVLKFKPTRLGPSYAGLFISLALNCVVPLDYFLGLPYALQAAGSCLLVFTPILFAAVIFAVSFGQSSQPNRDFGANIAGAMLGGLAENASMLLGFQYLLLVAVGFYAVSALAWRGWVAALATPPREQLAAVGR